MKGHEIVNKFPGQLYVVPTPIGNLSDISQRALKTLQSVDLIVAENIRHTSILLRHHAVQTHLFALHKYNEKKKLEWCWKNL